MKFTTEPKIDERTAKHYVGIRIEASGQELPEVIPATLGELYAWMDQRSIPWAGAPFLRFHVIDMAATMQLELGVPVANEVPGDGRVSPGVLPAGRYASLIYTGVTNAFEGNKMLIEWAHQQGIAWDRWDDPKGDAFAGRYESYLTNPEEEPDMAKWETEVAIKLADEQPAK
jgi:effector-binding domain-containing protein